MRSVVLLDLARELGLQESDGRHGRVQLIDVMLGEVGDSTSAVDGRSTDSRLNSTSEQLDQGRFTRSVRSDDGDTRVEIDVDVHALQNSLLGRITKSDFVKLKQRRRDLLWVGELERLRLVLLWRLELGQFLQNLDLTLSLRR